MKKTITSLPINDFGMSSVSVPRDSHLLGITTSPNGHQLYLNVIHDVTQQENVNVPIAVIASNTNFEIIDQIAVLGSVWFRDTLCHVFRVIPTPKQENSDIPEDNTAAEQ